MEIEIDTKRNNPLLNRTEVYFTVKHEGEGTPNREIIRSELAEKLNVKKENIIVSSIQSSFGDQEVTCYAKVYSSLAKSKELETDYIQQRNKLIEPKGKKIQKKPVEEKPAETAGETKKETSEELSAKPEITEKPTIEQNKQVEEPKKEEKPDETKEEKTPEHQLPEEETKEETTNKKPADEKKPDEKSKEEPIEDSEQSVQKKKE